VKVAAYPAVDGAKVDAADARKKGDVNDVPKKGDVSDTRKKLTKSRSTLEADLKAGFGRCDNEEVTRTEVPEATPESATAMQLPTPQQFIKQVCTPNQIFELVSHEFCAFGTTNPGRRGQAIIEPEFEEKNLEISHSRGPEDFRTALADLGIGICCHKAKKPQQPNQDNVFFCKMGRFTLCGVADGHGPDGHWASHWAARFVLRLLMVELDRTGAPPGDDVFRKVFDFTHRCLRVVSNTTGFDLNMSGATLTVCVVDHQEHQVVAAWVGDSRCAIGKAGSSYGESLTRDHKPQDAQEKKRIEASGGEVVKLEGDIPHRIFVRNSAGPGLAMSRAIGDAIAHTIGVIHEPDIVRCQAKGKFLLCCSDGVWEFIESTEAVQMVDQFGRQKVRQAVELLTLESRKRWLTEEECLTDDISAICVYV
jgi:serine/threonine protein phosphatase PrpC